MLALLLLACTSSEPETEEPTFHAPDAPGPYVAGTWQGLVEGDPDLTVQVWYPSETSVDSVYRYDGLIAGGTSGSVPPACDAPHPVVVFSHGNSGIRYQTWSLMEHFATHGFVVIAPDHAENTFLDYDESRWARIALRRPSDVQRAFDFVAEGPWDLGGCVDASAGYAMMGHSFGGFTTLANAGASYDMDMLAQWCDGSTDEGCSAIDDWFAEHSEGGLDDRSDDRVWAAVPLAPAWHEVLAIEQISVPTMVVGGDRDLLTTWNGAVLPVYEELQAEPRYLLQLQDTGHYSFTDFCDVVPNGDGCGDDYRPVEDVLATVRQATTAFLQVQLGQDEAWDYLPPDEGVASWVTAP